MKKEKVIATQEQVAVMSTSEIVRLMERDKRYAIIRNDDAQGTINRIIQRES
jgi:hypothetical protein